MKFIFKDTNTSTELVLPVTPESFEISHGINIEIVNIHTLGDVAIAGYGTLPAFKVECFFPARDYPFNQPSAQLDTYGYISKFKAWCDSRTVLRFVVSDTSVNIPVLIKDLTYSEKDGSRDVYAKLELKTYRELSALETFKNSKTGNLSRIETAPAVLMDSYVVVYGDTLSGISRKFYGDASLYQALADYNKIANANLIHPGDIIQLPNKALLAGQPLSYNAGPTAVSLPAKRVTTDLPM